MAAKRIIIVGAGIAGLAAAFELAAKGFDITVLEKSAAPGGKIREIEVSGRPVDSGPTVFTMRWVFEELFAASGESLAGHISLKPEKILARHAWSASERLDLHSSIERSAAAVGEFAGAGEAGRFLDFCKRAQATYQTLENSFIRDAQPTPISLARKAGLSGLGDLWRISPFTTLWRALGDHFHDPRLRQLFGRYATYCGSSPFEAPATLMLVAHVEQQGVWTIEGGMHRLAVVIAQLAANHGAQFRYRAPVSEVIIRGGKVSGVQLADGERLDADAVIVNADASAVATGILGRGIVGAVAQTAKSARSLSAVTWSLNAATSGFPLVRHNVFFSADYHAEFDDIFRRSRLPSSPTIYVCAQDRGDGDDNEQAGPERLLCLVNAPPIGDVHQFDAAEIEQCETRTFALLARYGLQVNRTPAASVITTPSDFNRLFPGTGGALYGQASHGWSTSFTRPASRTKIPGLYLAGGSTHPGPGVPMAALSGRLAVQAILTDLTSRGSSPATAMRGGTSTL